MGDICKACGHEHQGKRLAYICIGCPCHEKPGGDDALTEDKAKAIVMDVYARARAEVNRMRARLAAFEEREPLVQNLLHRFEHEGGRGFVDLSEEIGAILDFKLEGS